MPIGDTVNPSFPLDPDLSSPLQDDALKDFWQKLGANVFQATKKFQVDRIHAASGMVGSLDVEKVTLGTATIGRIEILGVEASLNSAKAYLQGVRTLTELHFTLDWKIDLGFIGKWDGSDSLGHIDIPFSVGDVTIPSLDKLRFEVPEVQIPGVQALMAPITRLNLGAAQLKGMQLDQTDIPAQGMQVVGLCIGQIKVSGVDIPATKTASANVQEVSIAKNIVLPEASLQNVKIPETLVNQVSSPSFATSAEVSTRSLTVNLGILKIKLNIRPLVHISVGSMILSDITLSTLAKQIKLKEISVPVSLEGIKASGIDLSGIKINELVF